MTYQEGCHRVTRAAAKKRAAESAGITEENVTNKKRFVLGEISNFTEIVGSMNTIQGKKKTQKLHPKEKAKTKPSVVRPLLKEAKENTEDEKQLDVGVVSDDPQMCGYYASHIYEYLHQMEVFPRWRPLPDYIEKVQNDVSTNMRAILVDWLVEVAGEYKLV
ncbi:cyclin-A3-2-like [Hibiscus syriacus]|uniref:cyclin-A3-2-like n=1 Tax=Hibiscus syriacus TaxID=106335 RepID=UPI0019217D67|nr:cyclin-A3-2-like [Hibiscus syriacus]